MLSFIFGLAIGTMFGVIIGSANVLAKITDMTTGAEDNAASRQISANSKLSGNATSV